MYIVIIACVNIYIYIYIHIHIHSTQNPICSGAAFLDVVIRTRWLNLPERSLDVICKWPQRPQMSAGKAQLTKSMSMLAAQTISDGQSCPAFDRQNLLQDLVEYFYLLVHTSTISLDRHNLLRLTCRLLRARLPLGYDHLQPRRGPWQRSDAAERHRTPSCCLNVLSSYVCLRVVYVCCCMYVSFALYVIIIINIVIIVIVL